MWTVTKSLEFCAGHRLLNYSGACSNIHGHNFKAEISVTKRVLDDSGIVVDFKEIKDKIGGWVDEFWDHGFLVNEHDDVLMKFFQDHSSFKKFILDLPHMVRIHDKLDRIHDKLDIRLDRDQEIAICNPTVENLSLILCGVAMDLLGHPVEVTLYESPSGWVTTS